MKHAKGWQHDFFHGDWSINCRSCGTSLDGPTRTMLSLIYKYHTKNECLGGW